MTPELAPALTEIEAVLKKHDLMGLVMISNATDGDWLMRVEASWSCARFEGEQLRIRCKTEEIPDVAERKRLLTGSIGSFVLFIDMMRKLTEQLMGILQMLHRNGIDIRGYNRTK